MAKYVNFWSVALGVFALDRITKLLVQQYLSLNSSIDFGIVALTYVQNTGTLFGLFKNASWFFVAFAAIVTIYILARYRAFDKSIQPILGLILAGAMGNLVDRLLYGSVIDFIDFKFWPVFNVADSVIVIAVCLLVLREYKRKI